MKKTYIAPETELSIVWHEHSMLTSSLEDERNVDGDPTTEGGLPGSATNTSDSENGSSTGNGQGTGGAGNRAKMWDDTWDLPQWWNF